MGHIRHHAEAGPVLLLYALRASNEHEYFILRVDFIHSGRKKVNNYPRESELRLTTPSDPVGRAIEICRSAHCLGDDDGAILYCFLSVLEEIFLV